MQGVPSGRPYTDAARRMTDAMNLHAVCRSRGIAVFALADGSTDNVAYETRDEAVRAKRWDRDNFLYLEIPAGGVSDPAEMQGCLDYARTLHAHGCRLPDPGEFRNGARDFPFHAPPVMRSDWATQIRNLTRK